MSMFIVSNNSTENPRVDASLAQVSGELASSQTNQKEGQENRQKSAALNKNTIEEADTARTLLDNAIKVLQDIKVSQAAVDLLTLLRDQYAKLHGETTQKESTESELFDKSAQAVRSFQV